LFEKRSKPNDKQDINRFLKTTETYHARFGSRQVFTLWVVIWTSNSNSV